VSICIFRFFCFLGLLRGDLKQFLRFGWGDLRVCILTWLSQLQWSGHSRHFEAVLLECQRKFLSRSSTLKFFPAFCALAPSLYIAASAAAGGIKSILYFQNTK
jgi:hypothetical protein